MHLCIWLLLVAAVCLGRSPFCRCGTPRPATKKAPTRPPGPPTPPPVRPRPNRVKVRGFLVERSGITFPPDWTIPTMVPVRHAHGGCSRASLDWQVCLDCFSVRAALSYRGAYGMSTALLCVWIQEPCPMERQSLLGRKFPLANVTCAAPTPAPTTVPPSWLDGITATPLPKWAPAVGWLVAVFVTTLALTSLVRCLWKGAKNCWRHRASATVGTLDGTPGCEHAGGSLLLPSLSGTGQGESSKYLFDFVFDYLFLI